MVIVPEAIVRHKGLMVDNTTKIELHLPELSPNEDAELIHHTKHKSAAVIIMDPNQLTAFQEVLEQVREIQDMPDEPEPEEVPEAPGPAEGEWEVAETGFESR